MDLATLDISDYSHFERHIERLREAEFPYAKFVTMVVHLPRSLAINHLRRATFHADPGVICEAMALLSRLSPIDGCPRGIELLGHEDSRVRQVAIETLHLMQIKCESSVLRLLQIEKDGDVRHACVRFLAVVGTQFSVQALREIKEKDTSVDYEGRSIAPLAENAIREIEAAGNLP